MTGSDFCPRCAPVGSLDEAGLCSSCGYDVAQEARGWAGEGYDPEDERDYEDSLAREGLSAQPPVPWLKLAAILAGIALLLYGVLSSLARD